MTDLRAERRAIAAQLLTSFCDGGITQADICDAYKDADAIIQHDLDNPPSWEDRVCHCEGGKSWCRYPTDDMKCGKHDARDAFRDGYVSGQDAARMMQEAAPSGWVRATDRLPTEADAPSGRIHGRDGTVTVTVSLHAYLSDKRVRKDWPYWHPAVGQFQIPEPPK
jgi:hypothetical protein